jgi:hypothetical protein
MRAYTQLWPKPYRYLKVQSEKEQERGLGSGLSAITAGYED